MANDPIPPLALTLAQRDTLIELASHGAGGEFDQMALSQLFVLGLIEVRRANRQIALTERGRSTYEELVGGKPTAQ
jgi:hypothetical protein